MSQQPYVQFHDGQAYPQLGLGTWKMDDAEAAKAVAAAIGTGYRHIDTAEGYANEKGVGEGVRNSGVAREEICVTTKLANGRQGYDEALRAFDESDKRLGIGPVDLYIIHWPIPSRDRYVDTFKAMMRLKKEGRIRSIGVSNFEIEHLERLIGETGEVPVLNQIELHPEFQQRELREYHEGKNIRTESWSPLGRGQSIHAGPIAEIAQKHGKTPTQIVLRWHIDQGLIVIPKSSRPDHQQANFDIFDFKLDAGDLDKIAGMDDPDGRMGGHPNDVS